MHLSTCVDTPEVGVQPPTVLTAERHPASVSYPVSPEEPLPHHRPELQLLPLRTAQLALGFTTSALRFGGKREDADT